MKKSTLMHEAHSDHTTVTLTVEKMEAAGVLADISHNGDLHLSLPIMSEEQTAQLNGVWARFRDDLKDINTNLTVMDAVLETAIQTHWKETNARIIANLL